MAPMPNGGDGEVCAYRGIDGTRCAVGCLITNKAYSKNIENHAVDVSEVKQALRKSRVNTSDQTVINMLVDLQDIHDHLPVKKWNNSLSNLEDKYFDA